MRREPRDPAGACRQLQGRLRAAAAGVEPAAQAAAVLTALGSLRHGRWWPPLDEIFGTARGFYPGLLSESPVAGKAALLT